MAVTIKRVRMDDIKIKMLVYGPPGAGKTFFAATANDHPELSPALFLNFEGGLLSVAGRGDIDSVDITSIEDLNEVFWNLQSGQGGFGQYKTIIIDSASELFTKALQEIVDKRIKSRGGSPDIVELPDRGTANHQVQRLFRMFRDLPINVIATAHAKMTYPAVVKPGVEPEPSEVVPSFPDKLGVQIRGMFDFVHYLFVYEDPVLDENGEETGEHVMKRGLLTQDRGPYKAKTRGYSFPERLGYYIDDPSLPAIYQLLIDTESQEPEEPQPYVEVDSSQEIPTIVDDQSDHIVEDTEEATEDTEDTETHPGPGADVEDEEDTTEDSEEPIAVIAPAQQKPAGVTPFRRRNRKEADDVTE